MEDAATKKQETNKLRERVERYMELIDKIEPNSNARMPFINEKKRIEAEAKARAERKEIEAQEKAEKDKKAKKNENKNKEEKESVKEKEQA